MLANLPGWRVLNRNYWPRSSTGVRSGNRVLRLFEHEMHLAQSVAVDQYYTRTAKTFGFRAERWCAQVLPMRVDERMPPELRRALAPLFEQG